MDFGLIDNPEVYNLTVSYAVFVCLVITNAIYSDAFQNRLDPCLRRDDVILACEPLCCVFRFLRVFRGNSICDTCG